MSAFTVALRTAVSRRIARTLTGPLLRDARRAWHAGGRRLSGRDPLVRYFHQPGDPYSALSAQLLPALQQRFRIRLELHAVPPPDAAAAPDAPRLAAWSARDAERLAARYGLALQDGVPAGLATDAAALRRGAALRARLGHYQGAMFWCDGEWFWGIDRLHHLASTLHALGSARATTVEMPGRARSTTPVDAFAPPPTLCTATPGPATHRPQLHFFCSLRSPYTWLSVPQVRALAAYHGADLRLRPVLPMVMRGLPVPWPKRRYILLDAKREADRLGLPFGDIVDPVGAPVERGLALVHHAERQGRGIEVVESFLRGVFAEGIDAGSDAGLLRIAERAGLASDDVGTALADDGWREVAGRNREDLLAHGLWGVPSFRVDDGAAVWGQDRLWAIEKDLIAARTVPTEERQA